MNFLSYIKSLVPTFTKNKVIESCELTQDSIKEHTLPAYTAAADLFKGTKFESKMISGFQRHYTSEVDNNKAGMIASIKGALENSLLILDAIKEESVTTYSENEINISLTYLKTTILKIVEACEFANVYSRRLLNYIYIEESSALDGSDDNKMSAAEIKWLDDNFLDFCLSIKVMKYDVKTIRQGLLQLPDANITELTEKTFISTLGANKLDPFQLRFISVRANPIYFFGMMLASYQADKYKAAKSELELLQLRKLNLQKRQEKAPDAKLEREIAYMQNRVTSLNYKLSQLEKDYDLG